MAKEPAKKKESKDKKENKNSFFKEFRAELKRVSWPTPRQLVNNTAIVIAIVVLVAAIVFVLDVIFENLNNFGVERLKSLVSSSSTETETTEDATDGSETVLEDGVIEDENGDSEDQIVVTDASEGTEEGSEESVETTETKVEESTETQTEETTETSEEEN